MKHVCSTNGVKCAHGITMTDCAKQLQLQLLSGKEIDTAVSFAGAAS